MRNDKCEMRNDEMASIAKFSLADYNFINRHKFWEVYRSEKYMVTPPV